METNHYIKSVLDIKFIRLDFSQTYKMMFSFKKKNSNTVYFTLITQKAHRTYRHVIEGMDVGILWSYLVD